MKNNYIKFFCKVLLFLVLTVSIPFALSALNSVNERIKSVVLVHLVYDNGTWSLGEKGVSVLPCDAPSKFIHGTKNDPLIKVLGTDGKVLYERNMRDPRLILVEDPTGVPKYLSKVSFVLRFALVDGMEQFEFWDSSVGSVKEQGPSLKVDLRGAVLKFKGQTFSEKVSCQDIEYKPDQLKK